MKLFLLFLIITPLFCMPVYATIVRQIILEAPLSNSQVKRVTIEGDSHRAQNALNDEQAERTHRLFSQMKKQDANVRFYLEAEEPRYQYLVNSLSNLFYNYSKAIVDEREKIEQDATDALPDKREELLEIISSARATTIRGMSGEQQLISKHAEQLKEDKNVLFLDNRIVFSQLGDVSKLSFAMPILQPYKAYAIVTKGIEQIPLSTREFFSFLETFFNDTLSSIKKLKGALKSFNLEEKTADLVTTLVDYKRQLSTIRAEFGDDDNQFFPELYQKVEEALSNEFSQGLALLFRMFVDIDQNFIDLFDLQILSNVLKNSAKNNIVITGYVHAENIMDELEAQGFKKIYDSFYTLQDGRRASNSETIYKILQLNKYADDEKIKKLQASVLAVPSKIFNYPLYTTEELQKLQTIKSKEEL